MATQTIEFGAPANQTVTARLFAAGSDTVVATATATARTNATGVYTADFTNLTPGLYRLIGTNAAGTLLCQWWTRTLAATGTYPATETPDADSITRDRMGYLDSVLIAANSNRTVQVTGSNHVAADIHDLQPAVITAADFAPGAIDANALAADAVVEIQSGLATAANQATILARLGAFTGTGINTVLGFLRAMASKQATTPSDIGGTYSATTDALEAIRDAQAAGTGDASQAPLEAVQDTVDAIAAKVSGGLIEVTSRVATGGNITLYIGDDARVRSGTEIEVTISDVGGTIYSRLDTLGVANLAWGASRRGLSAGAISGTISGLSQSGSGATQAITFVIEVNDAGDDLLPHDDYTWQIVSTSAAADEWVEVEGTLDLRRRVAVPV